MQAQNRYLESLIDPSFQGVNMLFVLSFEKITGVFSDHRNKRLQCYDWRKKFFDQPVKNNLRTYDNLRKIATDQGDDYTTGY